MIRDSVDRDRELESLEEHLLDLRGSLALPLSTYGDDDDSVTRVLQVPEALSQGTGEWLVALTQTDQRALTIEQILYGLARGQLRPDMLVWRRGLSAWQPLASVAELRTPRATAPRVAARRVAARCVAEASPPPSSPVQAPAPLEPSSCSAAERVSSSPALAQRATLVPPDLDLEGLALESGSLRAKRAVMAVSALAMTVVFVTLFALSSSSADQVSEAARQRAAAALLKSPSPERPAAKRDSAQREPQAEPDDERPAQPSRPRERARGVPRGAAAMAMGSEE